jgi:hypothetical protein
MVRNLYIISEGRSECNFVKNVLSAHFVNFNWIVTPTTLPTSRKSRSGYKGGWRRTDGYKYAIEEIRKTIITHGYELHTTFFDFYGFPTDIPCYEEAQRLKTPLRDSRTLFIKMKYVSSTLRGQTRLPALNQPVTTCVKQIIRFMSYQTALPVMIKGKLTKCCVTMKVKAVK